MTAKRFTIQGVGISDHERKRLYDLKTVDGFISIRDLLNEQHETIQRLKQNIDELLSVDIEEELLKENEQLKSSDTITDLETEIMNLKTTIQQLRTDNTKQKKLLNTTMKQNKHTTTTIQTMMENERTELGQSVLRQLYEAIQ